MKKISILTIVFLFGMSKLAMSQNQTYVDKKGDTHLIGQCDRNAFEQGTFKTWYDENYNNYDVNTDLLKQVKRKTKGVTFEIFMATWCNDSKRECPRFFKILDVLKVEESAVSIINVDNAETAYKQSPTHEEFGKLIFRVPTFIVYKNGVEIGRIVESPVTTLEMDLVQILLGFPTAPNYKSVHVLENLFAEKGVATDEEELLAYARHLGRSVRSSSELNSYGYLLLGKGEIDKALAVFYINVLLFRNEANSFDSLAEAYEKKGNIEAALGMYKTALKINPNSEHAKERVAELEQ
jgi:tetratricopeptide (TPR) repeat protein